VGKHRSNPQYFKEIKLQSEIFNQLNIKKVKSTKIIFKKINEKKEEKLKKKRKVILKKKRKNKKRGKLEKK
jgi:hypothetical protein